MSDGGASKVATVKNAVSPSVSMDCTLTSGNSSTVRCSVPSVFQTSMLSTADALDTTMSRSPRLAALTSTTSRSATTVRHWSGSASDAATIRPLGASRDVTA